MILSPKLFINHYAMKNNSISLKTPAICGVIAACASLPLSGYSLRAAVWTLVLATYVVFMARLFFAFRRHHAVASWVIELFAHIIAFLVIGVLFYSLGKCAERFLFEPSAYFEITVLYGALCATAANTILFLLLFAIRCICIAYREKQQII